MGEKLAVTPLGRPEALRVTGDSKSLMEVMVMVTVPEPPLTMVRDVGFAKREKSGGGFTVRDMVTDWVERALVPVTVIVKLPVVAVGLAVRDSVDVPGGLRELGVKVAVMPDGVPVTVSATKFVLPKSAPTSARSKTFTTPSLLMSAS